MRRRGTCFSKKASDVVVTNLIYSFGLNNVLNNGTNNYYNDPINGFQARINGGSNVIGKVGNAHNFPSNGAPLQIPNDPKFSIRDAGNTKNLSIAFSNWIMFYSLSSIKLIFNKRDNATQNEYQLLTNNKIIRLSVFNSDNTEFKIEANCPELLLNTFYHVAGYIDAVSGTGKIFVDNVDRTTSITGTVKTFNTGLNPIDIGKPGWDTAFYFSGKLDEHRLWIGETVPTDFSNEWNNGNGIQF